MIEICGASPPPLTSAHLAYLLNVSSYSLTKRKNRFCPCPLTDPPSTSALCLFAETATLSALFHHHNLVRRNLIQRKLKKNEELDLDRRRRKKRLLPVCTGIRRTCSCDKSPGVERTSYENTTPDCTDGSRRARSIDCGLDTAFS